MEFARKSFFCADTKPTARWRTQNLFRLLSCYGNKKVSKSWPKDCRLVSFSRSSTASLSFSGMKRWRDAASWTNTRAMWNGSWRGLPHTKGQGWEVTKRWLLAIMIILPSLRNSIILILFYRPNTETWFTTKPYDVRLIRTLLDVLNVFISFIVF